MLKDAVPSKSALKEYAEQCYAREWRLGISMNRSAGQTTIDRGDLRGRHKRNE